MVALLDAITIVDQIHTFILLVYFFFKTTTCCFQHFVWKLMYCPLICLPEVWGIIWEYFYLPIEMSASQSSKAQVQVTRYIYKLSVIFWAMNTWNCKNVSLHLCLEIFLLHLWLKSHIFAILSTCRTASRIFHTRSCSSSCVHRNFKLLIPPSSHDSVWNWIR